MLWLLTGGVPGRLTELLGARVRTRDDAYAYLACPQNPFLSECAQLFDNEPHGKRAAGRDGEAVTMSVLAAVAWGLDRAVDIAAALGLPGSPSVLPTLHRLEKLGHLERQRPTFADPDSRDVRWLVKDPAQAWMMFAYWSHPRFAGGEYDPGESSPHEPYPALLQRVRHSAESLRTYALALWFRAALRESGAFTEVNFW